MQCTFTYVSVCVRVCARASARPRVHVCVHNLLAHTSQFSWEILAKIGGDDDDDIWASKNERKDNTLWVKRRKLLFSIHRLPPMCSEAFVLSDQLCLNAAEDDWIMHCTVLDIHEHQYGQERLCDTQAEGHEFPPKRFTRRSVKIELCEKISGKKISHRGQNSLLKEAESISSSASSSGRKLSQWKFDFANDARVLNGRIRGTQKKCLCTC